MESFDNFLVLEAVVATATTVTIDGRLNQEFLDNSDSDQENTENAKDRLQTWGRVRPVCFELIKGKKLPLFFKVV